MSSVARVPKIGCHLSGCIWILWAQVTSANSHWLLHTHNDNHVDTHNDNHVNSTNVTAPVSKQDKIGQTGVHLLQAIGGDVPRHKRERTSRLGRKAGHKPKVDRFHYLFEAIEADKASDSETANGTGSRLSEGAEPDSAQATSKQPDQDTSAQAQAGPRDPGVLQSQETQRDTGSGAERPAGAAEQPAVGPAISDAVTAAHQAAQMRSDVAQTAVAGEVS